MIAAIFAPRPSWARCDGASPAAGASWRRDRHRRRHDPRAQRLSPIQNDHRRALRESQRVAVPGGSRVPLVSGRQRLEVVTSVHQNRRADALLRHGHGDAYGPCHGYVETRAARRRTTSLSRVRSARSPAGGTIRPGANRSSSSAWAIMKPRHRNGRSARSSLEAGGSLMRGRFARAKLGDRSATSSRQLVGDSRPSPR